MPQLHAVTIGESFWAYVWAAGTPDAIDRYVVDNVVFTNVHGKEMTMAMRHVLVGVVVAMLLTSGVVAATDAEDKQAVRQVYAKYLQSVNTADLTLAEQVWSHAADIVVVMPLGRFQGWNSVRDDIYINFLQKRFAERKLEGTNVAVHVSSDTAWLVYDWTFTAKTADGQPVNTKGWESHVYQRTRQGWRIVSLHYSASPPPPPR